MEANGSLVEKPCAEAPTTPMFMCVVCPVQCSQKRKRAKASPSFFVTRVAGVNSVAGASRHRPRAPACKQRPKVSEVKACIEVLLECSNTERCKEACKVLRKMLRGGQLSVQAAIMLNPMQDEEEKLSELLAFRLHQHLCGGGPELASLRRGRQGLWLGRNVSLRRHGCACSGAWMQRRLEPRPARLPRVLRSV